MAVRRTRVTMTIDWEDEEYVHPSLWDWVALIDTGTDTVRLLDAVDIEEHA